MMTARNTTKARLLQDIIRNSQGHLVTIPSSRVSLKLSLWTDLWEWGKILSLLPAQIVKQMWVNLMLKTIRILLPYFIQITTSVEVETGTVAWLAAGIICFVGCWCCAPIPLCMDSLKVRWPFFYFLNSCIFFRTLCIGVQIVMPLSDDIKLDSNSKCKCHLMPVLCRINFVLRLDFWLRLELTIC